jgi:hypothetical protein
MAFSIATAVNCGRCPRWNPGGPACPTGRRRAPHARSSSPPRRPRCRARVRPPSNPSAPAAARPAPRPRPPAGSPRQTAATSSVNVVLPASGCEMIAKVRRRKISSPRVLINRLYPLQRCGPLLASSPARGLGLDMMGARCFANCYRAEREGRRSWRRSGFGPRKQPVRSARRPSVPKKPYSSGIPALRKPAK